MDRTGTDAEGKPDADTLKRYPAEAENPHPAQTVHIESNALEQSPIRQLIHTPPLLADRDTIKAKQLAQFPLETPPYSRLGPTKTRKRSILADYPALLLRT